MQRVLSAIDPRRLTEWLGYVRGMSPRLVLTMCAASFLTASGFSLLFSYVLIPTEQGLKSQSRTSASSASPLPLRKPTAAADIDLIIRRNLFNSEGKLGDSVDGVGARGPRDAGKIVRSSLPLKLVGVIFAGDPFNGLAMIEVTDKAKVSSFMVSDTIQEGVKLVEVYDDRVVLETNSGREYLEMQKFQLSAGRRKRGDSSSGAGSSVGGDGGTGRILGDSYREEGFERKGNSIKISDEFKRNLLAPDQLTKVLQDAKAEPNLVGGELKGFRLTRIRESSVYEKAGFQNGDIIEEINGIPLRDAAGAIRLLNQLRNEKDVDVRVNRNGQVSQMTISVQ